MIKLGGRKFIGFACLCVLGLVMAIKGASLDNGVVTLLLGAYAIFAAANSMNSYQALRMLKQQGPDESEDSGDELNEPAEAEVPKAAEPAQAPLTTSSIDDQINLHLNNKVAPYIQQLAESDKQIQQVLQQIVTQMTQAKSDNRQLMEKALKGENPFEHLK